VGENLGVIVRTLGSQCRASSAALWLNVFVFTVVKYT
jgi:hypothetical protein